jgi:hypothetical protein
MKGEEAPFLFSCSYVFLLKVGGKGAINASRLRK